MKPIRMAILLSLLLLSTTVFATEVAPRNIEQMTQLSKRLFHGRCLSVKEHFNQNGISYTEYTFEVLSAFKGELAKTITFKQYGLINSVDVGNGLLYVGNIAGMPVYNPGKEYVLFLNEDSKLGLTSPLGLFQGSFKVMQNQKGERVVMNSLSNKGLFKNVQIGNNAALKMAKKKQEAEGAIELNAFFDMIKTLNK